jgi:ubiquinone/menaquinone biosynthesis C-methylase UbiE
VRWLLGGELHPGGERTTRRALELIKLRAGERLLDVASGTGESAMLAAREFGCLAAGVDYSAQAVRGAQATADARGLCNRVGFARGDAEALPFGDCSFDAALCECSLCMFPDKPRALAELRRVLRPGARLAISDVTADHARLPETLRGAMARVACVGTALSADGYRLMLERAGFDLLREEDRAADAAALALRVEDRLRGARLIGWHQADGAPTLEDAIHIVRVAREALAGGTLGYAIFLASRR